MLEILGTVFLIIIGLVIAVGLWLFVKVKSGMDEHKRVSAIEESMHLPEMLLEPNEHPSFAKPETVAMLVQQAADLGAISCGNYDVPAVGVRLCAYCLETPPVYIAIYDHDLIDSWTDVVVRLDPVRSFTASTAPEIGRGAPRHSDDEILYFALGTKTGVLVQEAADRANNASPLAATPEAFKDYFEAAAEKSRQYIQTKAVSQDWLETIADDAGVELSGDEAEQINLMREDQQGTDIEAGCFKSLAESGDLSAAQWNEIRDNLVAVWDDMPPEYVSGVFYSHVDFPDELESDVDALEHGHGRARERIAELNAKLPEEKRLFLVGRVSSPVEADIYRGQMLIV